MDRRRIVVIEDEAAIRRGVVDILKVAGYDPVEAADGVQGLSEGRRLGVDLVLLDLRLPKLDGLQVLSELRKTHPTLPIIILTARGSEDDRVKGLKGGADDYVVKPFSARELLARVEAVLRRTPSRPVSVRSVTDGVTRADLERCEVTYADGRQTALSQMEAAILGHLSAHPSRVISREELLTCVWGISSEALETRAVDMHITRLRGKLSGGKGGGAAEWIVTVRGKGYKLGPQITTDP